MLKGYDTATMIPAKDLEKTRRFYEDVLGFSVDSEDPGGIRYQSGGSSFFLYPTQFAGTAQHTLIGWNVDDIESVVDDLASKGIMFEQYDMGEFKTDAKGIATMGPDRGAWFKDPEGNILSVWQKAM
ncbi:MAG TPA: VOC family protein [Actinomycetota bacterium]|jgi:catechol 2,3-dioxygenase-like lactoylglutathione lyase family enzyme|nr:VOC family protein [Actinomycetota bacterium]